MYASTLVNILGPPSDDRGLHSVPKESNPISKNVAPFFHMSGVPESPSQVIGVDTPAHMKWGEANSCFFRNPAHSFSGVTTNWAVWSLLVATVSGAVETKRSLVARFEYALLFELYDDMI